MERTQAHLLRFPHLRHASQSCDTQSTQAQPVKKLKKKPFAHKTHLLGWRSCFLNNVNCSPTKKSKISKTIAKLSLVCRRSKWRDNIVLWFDKTLGRKISSRSRGRARTVNGTSFLLHKRVAVKNGHSSLRCKGNVSEKSSSQIPKSISSSSRSTQARLSVCLLSANMLKWIEESAY